LFTGNNALVTIPNCLKLNSNKIRFIAPSPASSLFEQAFASVTEEELNLLVFFDKEKREKYIAIIKERLTDIAATKLNHRRYKDKDYGQKQVDKCFEGPKQYLRKVFGNPLIIEKDGCLELSCILNNELLKKLEQRDGLYPVVTNVYDQNYTTEELFLRTCRKYSVEQPMRHLKSKIKIWLMFLHIDERIRGLALVTFMALMVYCILEHLAKQNLDPKATTNLLMKEFAAIVFSLGEILDGTSFQTVGNVKERHIRLINKLGLAIGSYADISEAQLE